MLKMKSVYQTLDANSISGGKFAKDLDRVITELLKEAIEVWIRTALEIIPVWSTASVYTLQALGSDAGIAISATPKENAPDRGSLGRSNGFGGLFRDQNEWYFEYETSLDYLINNENNSTANANLITPIPYHFREQSNEAAQKFVDGRLPDILPELLAENIVTGSFIRG